MATVNQRGLQAETSRPPFGQSSADWTIRHSPDRLPSQRASATDGYLEVFLDAA